MELASALENQEFEHGPSSGERLFHFHVKVIEEVPVMAEKDVRFLIASRPMGL